MFHEFEVVLKFCCKTVKPLKTTLYSQCSFAIVSTKMWENVILFYYSSVKGISLKNFPWRGKKVPTSMLLLLTPLPMNFCAMISNFLRAKPCLFMKKSLNDIAFDIFALTAVVNITKICIQQHKMCNKKGCLTTSYYSTTFSRPFIQIHHLMIPSNKPLFNVPLISDKNVEFHAFQRRNNYFCT